MPAWLRFAARMLALLVLALPLLGAAAQDPLFGRESRDLARDLAGANAARKGLLVMFETADCPYCAEMRRKVFVRPSVLGFYRRHFADVAVRLDSGEALRDPLGADVPAAQLARRYGLAGTPGFAFFDGQGRLIARHQGALAGPADFISLGRYVRSGAYETQSFAAWRRGRGDAEFDSAIVTARPFFDFAFRDVQSRPRRLNELRGRIVLLAFGYTQCPDVCPTTMAEMQEIMHKLGADASRVQPLFISVDAERDTPAMMGSYAAAFDPRIAAGVIDAQQLDRLRKSVGLVAERQPGDNTYSIDHSAGFFILDAQGRLRLRSDYGQDTASVLADLRRLLAAGRKSQPSS